MDNSVRRVSNKIQMAIVLLMGGYIAYEAPDAIRSHRENNKAAAEDSGENTRVLEKYAPQIKDGIPLTADQGEDLIYGEYDIDQNRHISIAEGDKVRARAESMTHYSFPGWKESGQSILEARKRIGERQSKEH